MAAPDPPEMPSRQVLVDRARGSIRKGSRSFAAASRLFDRQTRERVWLLYAWCRACDDIADLQDHGHARSSDNAPLDPASRLATIRTMTELALAGEPTGVPAFDALGQLTREVPLSRATIEDVIAGFALDMREWRPRTEADLLRYCYHVAGAVGVLMATVMGVSPEDEDTLDRACDLGLAFQLANILRDIRQDEEGGRCYLPGDWLEDAGIPAGAVASAGCRQALLPLVARAGELAGGYEASARIGARRLAWRQRWAVLAAANIYGEIGREVVRRGAGAWTRRVHIGRWRKLGLLISALAEVRRGAGSPREAQERPRLGRRDLMAAARA